MTFTVMGLDQETGKIGHAVTTGSFCAGAFLPAFSKSGALAISQAFAYPELGFQATDLIDQGVSLDQLTEKLAATDRFYSWRQLAILTGEGKTFVHTGEDASDWKGHVAGKNCIAVGNALAGAHVVEAMAESFESNRGVELTERLLTALEAGRDAGGQASDEDPSLRYPELSAQIWVCKAGSLPEINLRVDFDIDALSKLRRLYEAHKTLGYKLRGENPPKYIEEYAPDYVAPEWHWYKSQI